MLFKGFPREMGPPRKVVHNKKEYLDYINLYNGKKKIYTSIYYFPTYIYEPYYKPDYNSAVVDKIYFDFDDKSCNAYKECMKLHLECDKENLKHCIIMSGRGYHLYIFCKIYIILYKKEAIRGAQQYFIDKLKLTVDRQVLGNVAQLARIPNTFNLKGGRFCITLTRKQFELGDYFIKHLAKEQNFVKDVIMGKELLDISEYDIEPPSDFSLDIPKLLINTKFNISSLKEIPPCISKLMENKNCRWKGRYLIILYFKEKGYLKEEVFQILKECLSEKKLKHCIKEEKQLQYLFRRDDLMFPSCETLMSDGFCPGKCEFYNSVIYR